MQNDAPRRCPPITLRPGGLWSKRIYIIVTVLIMAVGLFFRVGGLFRGLDGKPYIYHPDTPKQVQALERFLDGRYVWYVGSWFYDGYPYGLNHVDEALLRPVLAARDALSALLRNDAEPAWNLYHWARVLRVFYGVLSIVLVLLTCKLLGLSRLATLFGTAVVAFSPLAISVAHTATGDIGVDLFVSFALVALALHRRYPASILPVLTIALCSGMAFSCKYHGLLTLLWIPLILGLEALIRRRFGRMFRHGLAALPMAVVGILALKPELMIDFDRSWAHMVNNFVKIKDYNVSPAFKELPLLTRLAQSWGHNLPRLANAFQPLLLMIALIGLFFFGYRLLKAIGKKNESFVSRSFDDTVRFVLCAFPFLVIILAVSGKPRLHPFHFSFVVPVLAVCGATMLSSLQHVRMPSWGRLAAGVPFILILSALIHQADRDHFFWTRDDNIWMAQQYAATVLETPFRSDDKRGIKLLELEKESPAIFRNRHPWSVGRAPGLTYMKEMRSLPLPEIPYPVDMDYLFCNGPVFLRSDRQFHAKRHDWTERVLVFTNPPPASLCVGVRSFTDPVAMTVDAGGETQLPVLGPHAQQVKRITVKEWRRSSFRYSNDQLWLVPLKIFSGVGESLVTILETDADQERFEVFGGQQRAYPEIMLRKHLKETVETAVSGQRYGYWQNEGARQKHQFDITLVAGRYRIKLDVVAPSDGQLELKLNHLTRSQTIQAGLNRFDISIVKPFAPLVSNVEIVSDMALDLRLLEIKPDSDALFSDFSAWATGTVPVWVDAELMRVPIEFQVPQRNRPLRFGDIVVLSDIRLQTIVSGTPRLLAVAMQAELPDRRIRHIGEYRFFVHLYDQENRQVYAGSVPVGELFAESVPHAGVAFALPDDLPAGDYAARIGIWNARTRLNTRPKRTSWFSRPPSESAIGSVVIK